MGVNITTGNNYEIFDSGTVITFKEESIVFKLSSNMNFILKFEEDSGSNEKRMKYSTLNENTLEIIATNFNNSLGTGNAEPLPLGVLNNRKLYLNFVANAIGDGKNKIVHYTWYLGEEVNNER